MQKRENIKYNKIAVNPSKNQTSKIPFVKIKELSIFPLKDINIIFK